MRWILIVGLLGLVGCEAESADKRMALPDWFFAESFETEEGLIIYELSDSLPYSNDLHDQWWIETQQCLQMEAPPPIIVMVDDFNKVCPPEFVKPEFTGMHCSNDDDLVGWFIAILSTVNWSDMASYRQNIKHEFIHYIREENGDRLHKEHRKNDPLWQCQWN